jgi:hypothetical protein
MDEVLAWGLALVFQIAGQYRGQDCYVARCGNGAFPRSMSQILIESLRMRLEKLKPDAGA